MDLWYVYEAQHVLFKSLLPIALQREGSSRDCFYLAFWRLVGRGAGRMLRGCSVIEEEVSRWTCWRISAPLHRKFTQWSRCPVVIIWTSAPSGTEVLEGFTSGQLLGSTPWSPWHVGNGTIYFHGSQLSFCSLGSSSPQTLLFGDFCPCWIQFPSGLLSVGSLPSPSLLSSACHSSVSQL